MKLKFKSSKYSILIILLIMFIESVSSNGSNGIMDEYNDENNDEILSLTLSTTVTPYARSAKVFRSKNLNHINHHHHHHKRNNSNNKKLKNSIKRQEKSTLSTNQLMSSSSRSANSVDEPDFDYALGKYQKDPFSYDLGNPRSNYDTSSSSVGVPSVFPQRPPNSILTNLTVILGQNALLSCTVRNLGSHNILWLRVKDGDVLAYDDMLITQDPRIRLIKKNQNESSLFIQGVKLNDAGEYACQINTQSVKSKFINLIILTPPVFTESELNSNDLSSDAFYPHMALASSLPNSKKMNSQTYYNQLQAQQQNIDASTKSVQVVEGRPINLECNAFGNPKPTINWYVRRYKSANLTVFSLNTNKITVNNVMRRQYEYFECEATNKLPPSVSKKFRINVLYRPEISVLPSKILITSLPTQVRFNCTVSAYPLSNVYWTHSFRNTRRNNNSKKLRETHKKNRTNINRDKTSRKLGNRNLGDQLDQLPLEHIQILNTLSRYSVSEQTLNETLKQSSILINVENEDDLGVYECFSNNSAGYRAVKFHINGDQFKSASAPTPSSTSYSNNKNRQLDSYLTTRSLSSAGRILDRNDEESLMIDEKLITNNESNNENSNNREIKFDLTTITNLQTSKSPQSTYFIYRSPSNNIATSLFLMLNILLLFFY